MRGNDRPQTIPECLPWKIWKLRHIHIILQQSLIGRARPQIGSTCGFCNAPTCIGLIIDLASGALLARVWGAVQGTVEWDKVRHGWVFEAHGWDSTVECREFGNWPQTMAAPGLGLPTARSWEPKASNKTFLCCQTYSPLSYHFLLGYFAKLYYSSLNIAMFLKKASPFHFPYFIIYDFVGNRCGRFLAEIIIVCLCVKNENLKVDSTDGKGMIAADTLLFVLPATCSCFLLFADDLVELLQQKVSNTFPTKVPVPRSGGHCLLQSGRLGLFTDASNTTRTPWNTLTWRLFHWIVNSSVSA